MFALCAALALLCGFNFEASAQCAAGETEYGISVPTVDNYFGEYGWELLDASGALVAELPCGALTSSAPVLVCLVDGADYTFNAYDDWGDGWGGGTYLIQSTEACPVTVATGSPDNGTAGDTTDDCAASDLEESVTFTEGVAVGPVLGCTDPTAVNYDSCAEQDDGTCVLPPTCGAGQSLFVIDLFGGFAPEIAWELLDGSGNVVVEQTCGNFDNSAPIPVCLNDGETYTFNAYDDWGDTWNNDGFYTITGPDGCIFDSGAPDNGLAGDGTDDCIGLDLESSQTFVAGPVAECDAEAYWLAADGSALDADGNPFAPVAICGDVIGLADNTNASGDVVVYARFLPFGPCYTDYSVSSTAGVLLAADATTPLGVMASNDAGWLQLTTADLSAPITLTFTSLVDGTCEATLVLDPATMVLLTGGAYTTAEDACFCISPSVDATTPFEIVCDPADPDNYSVTFNITDLGGATSLDIGYLNAGAWTSLSTVTAAGSVTVGPIPILTPGNTLDVILAYDGVFEDDLATPVDETLCNLGLYDFNDTSCQPECTTPPSSTVVQYCDGDGVLVDVTTTFGDPASTYTISNNAGVPSVPAVDGTLVTVGPFPSNTDVTIVITDDNNQYCYEAFTVNSFCQALTCGDAIADPGGPTGDYENNAFAVYEICPQNAGDAVVLTLTAFDLENTYDFLTVLEADGTTQLGDFTGTTIPGPVTATQPSGCLFVVFDSDVSGVAAGFEGTISCEPLACPAPPTLETIQSTCSTSGEFFIDVVGVFGDPAGSYTYSTDAGTDTWPAVDSEAVTIGPFPNGTSVTVTMTDDANVDCTSELGPILNNCYVCGETITSPEDPANPGFYPNDTDVFYTVCDASGAPITLTFDSFDLESEATCAYDFVDVYDGIGVTLLGTFCSDDGTIPGPFTSTDASGCLLVVFSSDVSTVGAGFSATASLGVPAADCDDMDANTINDVWDATGCICAGEPIMMGCTDPAACNYDETANMDDGTCYFTGESCDDMDPTTVGDTWDANCVCGGASTPGCTDPTACNFDMNATADDGSCYFTGDTCDDMDATTVGDAWDANCVCVGVATPGCIDPAACNYDDTATVDDGSCYFTGDACDDMDPTTVGDTWGPDCLCGGAAVPGCMDAASCTFEPTATVDDGSCLYNDCLEVCGGTAVPGSTCDDGNPDTAGDTYNGACECVGAFTGDDCNDPLADNFSPLALSNSQCNYFGCTDPAAINYNANASLDDGSCILANCTIDGSIDLNSNAQGTIFPVYYDSYDLSVTGFTGPLTFDWDRSGYVRFAAEQDGTMQVIAADNASFSVTITDANGCVFIFDEDYNGASSNGGNYNGSTTPPDADVILNEIKGETNSNFDGAINISITGGVGPFEYLWEGPGGFTSTSEDLAGIESGHYHLTVTDTGTGQITYVSYWVPKDRRSGRLKTADTEAMINVYPNPFVSVSNLDFASTEAGVVKVDLVDLSGKVIQSLFEGKVEAGVVNSMPLDAATLPTGVYLAQITTPNGFVQTVKIIATK